VIVVPLRIAVEVLLLNVWPAPERERHRQARHVPVAPPAMTRLELASVPLASRQARAAMVVLPV